MKPKYVRFVVREPGWRHLIADAKRKIDCGLFTAARLEIDEGRFKENDKRKIQRIFRWFNNNIIAPPFSKKHGKEWSQYVICWWKITAELPIKKLKPLCELLESYGLYTRIIYTTNPGKIVYEDKWQIVAEPKPRMTARLAYSKDNYEVAKA